MLEGMKNKYNLSGILASVVVVLFGVLLLKTLNTHMPFGKDKMQVAAQYVELGGSSTGAQNMVTSVVLSFRALDTLGEVTVLFASAMAVALLLAPGAVLWRRKENFVLKVAAKWMPYLVGLIGAYIVSQGHLTPGGGFQGGVIIATGVMIMLLLAGNRKRNELFLHSLEALMGLSFITVGIIGLIKGGSFLYNFLPNGKVGSLFSAGILPLLYIFIGIKVASEFVSILDRFTSKVEKDAD